MSTGADGAAVVRPVMAAIRPAGTTSSPPSTTGGRGEIWRFELQFLHALLQPRLQIVGPLAGLARVEPGVGLAGLLLELELLGAVVPVGDLLGQPVLHRRLGLGDELELAVAHLLEVLRHDLGDRVALRLLLELAVDPRALGPIEDRVDARFALGQRPVVEVGRIVEVARRARRRRARRRASAWRRRDARPIAVRLASWIACSR